MTIDGLKDGDEVAVKATVGKPRRMSDWSGEPPGTTWVTTRNVASDGTPLAGGNGARVSDDDIVRPVAKALSEQVALYKLHAADANHEFMKAKSGSREESDALERKVVLDEVVRDLERILKGET
jgi:hypothetical protein